MTMNSYMLFLFVFSVVSDICLSELDTCSAGNISKENDIEFADLVGKIWYVHVLLDDTRNFSRDAKLMFQPDAFGHSYFAYYAGRSLETNQCETSVFNNFDHGMKTPCKSGQRVYPAPDNPGVTFILTFLDETKKRVLLYICYDFDESNNTCNTVAAFGFTTRRRLKGGEKEAFEEKIEAFGRPLPEGLSEYDIDHPNKNNCEDPIPERLGIRKEKCIRAVI